jgi:S1-C subfamily serine protease
MGIGFAIPINKAKSLEATLAAGKEVSHPYIGVQMLNLTPELARENNRDPNSPILVPEVEGILVVRVMPNSPAEKAGLRRGDVIIAADGKRVTDGGELQGIVENAGINQKLKLKLQRGAAEGTLRARTFELTVQTEQLASK